MSIVKRSDPAAQTDWFDRAKAIVQEHNPDLGVCPDCGGSGERYCAGFSVSPFSGVSVPDPQMAVSVECPACRGSGEAQASSSEEWADGPCRMCGQPIGWHWLGACPERAQSVEVITVPSTWIALANAALKGDSEAARQLAELVIKGRRA